MAIPVSRQFRDYQAAYHGASSIAFPFWGSPVLTDDKGRYYCPGFVGETFAASTWDKVFLSIPFESPYQPYTPGIAEVSVHKFRDVDKKKKPGSDGARITIHGIEPALVEIRLTIWTPEQFRWLSEIWPVLFPGPTKTLQLVPTVVGTQQVQWNTPVALINNPNAPTLDNGTATVNITKNVKKQKTINPIVAYDVSHPLLDLHEVKSLVFTSGKGPDPGSVPKSRVFTINAVEFIQQISKTAVTTTPEAAKGSLLDPGQFPTPGSDSRNTGP